MSEPLLNVMKIMLLAGLYLFFVRVLWSVYNELRDPRSVVKRRNRRAGAATDAAADAVPPTPTIRQAAPMPVPGAPAAPLAAPAMTRSPHPVIGQLVVVEPPALAGTTWALAHDTTLGRLPTCGIVLDDTYVSSVHVRIFVVDNAFMIEDLSSRNGTMLNAVPLTATTPLRPGDRISIGAMTVEFS